MKKLALALLALSSFHVADAQTLGLVSDRTSEKLLLLDADLLVVVDRMDLPGIPYCDNIFGSQGYCVPRFAPELDEAYAVTGQALVWVIAIDGTTLSIEEAPIPVASTAHDIAVSPDGRFLLVGGWNSPISVVDVFQRREVNTVYEGSYGVDFCDDGTALLMTPILRRVAIDPFGELTELGVSEESSMSDVFCGTNTLTGFYIEHVAARSFTVPELEYVEERYYGGGHSAGPQAVAYHLDTRHIYVSNSDGIRGHRYNFANGDIQGVVGSYDSFSGLHRCLGAENVQVHPDDGTVFYGNSHLDEITLYNTDMVATGSITDPDMRYPASIDLRTRSLDLASFDAQLGLGALPGHFRLRGEFSLGRASDKIQPSQELFRLHIGDYQVVLAPGSFVQELPGAYRFQGTVGADHLSIILRELPDMRFLLGASGFAASQPVFSSAEVFLRIGDDRGTTIAEESRLGFR